MASEPDKNPIDAEIVEDQLSTAHDAVASDAPRGNVHSHESDAKGDLPGDMPPPHGF